MNKPALQAEPLLTSSEVALLFRVDTKTVTRWAKAGKLSSLRTLGGHRRYREAEVRALLASSADRPGCHRRHDMGGAACASRGQTAPAGKAAPPGVYEDPRRLSSGPPASPGTAGS